MQNSAFEKWTLINIQTKRLYLPFWADTLPDKRIFVSEVLSLVLLYFEQVLYGMPLLQNGIVRL